MFLNSVEVLKEIVRVCNFLDTDAGERFRDLYGIRENIQAVISFSGRSKKHESYCMSHDSDYDGVYVTHLYIDSGELKVQMSNEDTDDFTLLLHPSNIDIGEIDDETINEWVTLLDW